MLDLVDETLEALFRAAVPLRPTEVDVAFEPPDQQWSARISRPTVNLFLWDIRRSTARARTGLEEVEQDGRRVRRLALPVLELRYVATVWTPNHADERALLSGVTRTLLQYPTIPEDAIADGMRDLRPPTVGVARADEAATNLFTSPDSQLKAAVNFTVTTEVDTERDRARPLADPPDGVSVAVGRQPAAPIEVDPPRPSRPVDDAPRRLVAGEAAGEASVGLLVRSPSDAAVVNAAGQFLIRARTGDEVVLMSEPERRVVVPDEGGVVIP